MKPVTHSNVSSLFSLRLNKVEEPANLFLTWQSEAEFWLVSSPVRWSKFRLVKICVLVFFDDTIVGLATQHEFPNINSKNQVDRP